mmetsp:Transcript_155123/g.497385  ORF Transcript_155123/g.497385 Transcript_155123/m.497385 type:complete len:237 (-) Transcript_155123:2457-3167(-)
MPGVELYKENNPSTLASPQFNANHRLYKRSRKQFGFAICRAFLKYLYKPLYTRLLMLQVGYPLTSSPFLQMSMNSVPSSRFKPMRTGTRFHRPADRTFNGWPSKVTPSSMGPHWQSVKPSQSVLPERSSSPSPRGIKAAHSARAATESAWQRPSLSSSRPTAFLASAAAEADNSWVRLVLAQIWARARRALARSNVSPTTSAREAACANLASARSMRVACFPSVWPCADWQPEESP